MIARLLPVALGSLLGVACSRAELPLEERGRRAYVANCTACHHADPTLEGVMGPEIAGSSHALIEARVLRGEYPPGYTPKRDTKLMQPLPYLGGEIDALAAYIASF